MIIEFKMELQPKSLPFDREYFEKQKTFADKFARSSAVRPWTVIHHNVITWGYDRTTDSLGYISAGAAMAQMFHRVFGTEITGKIFLDEFTTTTNPLLILAPRIKVTTELLYEEYADQRGEDLFGPIPIIPFNKLPEEFRNGCFIPGDV